jgi:outer membrane protein OmpA-like peptidoglycan-associated protein
MKNTNYTIFILLIMLLSCKVQKPSTSINKTDTLDSTSTNKSVSFNKDVIDKTTESLAILVKTVDKKTSLYEEMLTLKTAFEKIISSMPSGEYEKMKANQEISDMLFHIHYNLPIIEKNVTRNVKSELLDVYFNVGESNLEANVKESIRNMMNEGLELAEEIGYPAKNVRVMIDIVGYASPDGNRKWNMELSKRRADSVKDFIDIEIHKYFTNKNFSYIINEPTGYGEDKDRKERVCTVSFFVLPNE